MGFKFSVHSSTGTLISINRPHGYGSPTPLQRSRTMFEQQLTGHLWSIGANTNLMQTIPRSSSSEEEDYFPIDSYIPFEKS